MDSDQTLAVHVDRISTLPDDVISNNILSLLPTRDSVRTSVLSTRWKRLYASVPVLDFRHHSQHLDQTDLDFAGFVYNVINRLSRISKVYIDLSHIRVSSTDIISWIDTATSHFVQELEVYGFGVEAAVTPHSLFTCKTLVSLNLDLRFVLSVPDNVCLPKLKNLWLKNLIFGYESNDESVRRLLSSCPVLETLMFSGSMHYARVFNVSVPSLKVLSLYLHDCRIELLINCPNLEELNCECYAARGYTGDVLGSLKKCDIEVELSGDEEFQQGKLIELVRQVCKVQSLSLCSDSMQALLVPPGSLPTFENLIRLKLEASFPDGWQLLPIILNSSPRLETLVFKKGFSDMNDNFGNPFPPPDHVPVCLSFHLKVIKIDRFIGEEDEYKWVEYFLTNALVLEKMEICLWSPAYSDEESDPNVEGEGQGQGQDEGQGEGEVEGEEQEEGEGEEEEEEEDGFDLNFERHFEIGKRLLTFQRSSEVCQIVLLPSDY